MKRILEGILAIIIAILSCIIFINIILRYGFHTSILSIDELSRLLFVWLTFIGAIVAYMDNSHVQVTFLVEKLSPANQQRVSLLTHTLILLLCLGLAWGAIEKTAQDWSNLSPILGVPVGLMYAAAIPTSLIIALLELRHLYRQFTNTPAETNKEPDDDNPYIYCQFVRGYRNWCSHRLGIIVVRHLIDVLDGYL